MSTPESPQAQWQPEVGWRGVAVVLTVALVLAGLLVGAIVGLVVALAIGWENFAC